MFVIVSCCTNTHFNLHSKTLDSVSCIVYLILSWFVYVIAGVCVCECVCGCVRECGVVCVCVSVFLGVCVCDGD